LATPISKSSKGKTRRRKKKKGRGGLYYIVRVDVIISKIENRLTGTEEKQLGKKERVGQGKQKRKRLLGDGEMSELEGLSRKGSRRNFRLKRSR